MHETGGELSRNSERLTSFPDVLGWVHNLNDWFGVVSSDDSYTTLPERPNELSQENLLEKVPIFRFILAYGEMLEAVHTILSILEDYKGLSLELKELEAQLSEINETQLGGDDVGSEPQLSTDWTDAIEGSEGSTNEVQQIVNALKLAKNQVESRVSIIATEIINLSKMGTTLPLPKAVSIDLSEFEFGDIEDQRLLQELREARRLLHDIRNPVGRMITRIGVIDLQREDNVLNQETWDEHIRNLLQNRSRLERMLSPVSETESFSRTATSLENLSRRSSQDETDYLRINFQVDLSRVNDTALLLLSSSFPFTLFEHIYGNIVKNTSEVAKKSFNDTVPEKDSRPELRIRARVVSHQETGVGVEETKYFLVITFADDGPGFPLSDEEAAVEPINDFYEEFQFHEYHPVFGRTTKKQSGGMGIGIAGNVSELQSRGIEVRMGNRLTNGENQGASQFSGAYTEIIVPLEWIV